jgi:hypothetical protein
MDATTSDRGKLSERDDDFVRGAREHNVKYVSLNVPRNTAATGASFTPDHIAHCMAMFDNRLTSSFFLTHGTCEGARGCRAKSYLPKASVA